MKKQHQHAAIFKGLPKHKTLPSGESRWVVEDFWGGRHRKRTFDNLAEARDYQELVKLQFIQLGDTFDVLPKDKRAELLGVCMEMEKCGTSLREVWDFYQTQYPGTHYSLAEALDLFLKAKKEQDRRPAYLDTLDRFAARVQKSIPGETPLAQVSQSILEKWLGTLPKRSRLSYLRWWKAFTSHAIKKGWLHLDPCRRIEVPSLAPPPPEVIPNETIRTLLSITMGTYQYMVPFYLLGFYAGLRPKELERINWTDVNLEEGLVVVDSCASKVRRRRPVKLLGNASGILKLFRDQPIISKRHRKGAKLVSELLPSRIHRDGMRHTAATHMVNVYESFEKAAKELGNSPDILKSTYYGIATPKQTQEFIQIL